MSSLAKPNFGSMGKRDSYLSFVLAKEQSKHDIYLPLLVLLSRSHPFQRIIE